MSPLHATTPEALSAPGRGGGRAPRLLLADDDRAMRTLLCRALSERGYEVEVASDGQQLLDRIATALLLDDRFDLVVSDVRMPVASGLAILRGVREWGWRIPFVLITAFGDAAMHAEARALGAVLLDKPFRLSDLLDVVGRAAPLDCAPRDPAAEQREERLRDELRLLERWRGEIEGP